MLQTADSFLIDTLRPHGKVQARTWNHYTATETFNSTAISAVYAKKMNNIRFFSICSIVWCHCLFNWESLSFSGYSGELLQMLVIQAGRIGTICFFIISGYFLADKLPYYTLKSYISNRFRSIIVPWLAVLLLFVGIRILHLHYQQGLPAARLPFTALVLFKSFIFNAAYWFVPVSLISGALLVIAKKNVHTAWFGIALAVITLFYGINLYGGWLPAAHTKAVLAYVFFLWLGVQLRLHLQHGHMLVLQISWARLLPLVIMSLLLACWEGILLKHRGCSDPYASIRLSNGLTSILLFIVFLKNPLLHWLNRLHPQHFVYGIYLLHSIIICESNKALGQLIQGANLGANIPGMLLIHLLYFGIVLGLTLALVMLLRRSPLHGLVGR